MLDTLNKINIAIDGPAGAGKSTIARLLANELGYIYVDTGAMYRGIALKSLQAGLRIEDQDQIARLAADVNIQLIPKSSGQQVLVDGDDVTHLIRTSEVNQRVSHIAQIAQVRALLVAKQQDMARHKGVVMDGRDIATHVLPNAELKIYLTASAQERARRRFNEMEHPSITMEELEKEIAQRDELDMKREQSPLVVAPDAIIIDCTELSIEDVIAKILDLYRTKMGRE